MNLKDTLVHLQTLFKDCEGYIELRIFENDAVKPYFFESINKCLDFLKSVNLDYCDVYVGVNPRKFKPEKGGGKSEHIETAYFIFADLDFKEKVNPESLSEDILSRLEKQGFAWEEGELYIKYNDKVYRLFKPSEEDFLIAIKNRLNKIGIDDITLIIDSGWGYHIYIRLSKPLPVLAWKELQKRFIEFVDGDPQTKDPARILRLAGSYNNRFPHYRVPCRVVYSSNYEVDPDYLLNQFKEFEKREVERVESSRKLTPYQKEQIVKLFLPYWDEGRRHALSLMLAGAFYWHGYSKDDAIAVIEEICARAKDEEVKDRIRAVEDTYRRAEEKLIAYKSEDFLSMMSNRIDSEEYERLVYNLLKIIKGSFIISKKSIVVKKSENTLIVADGRSCMIKEIYVKEKDGETHMILKDTIATVFPTQITVIQDVDSELLKITFVTSDGHTLTLEGDLDEISTQLKKMTVRVTSRKKLEDALSLLISKMLSVGMCKKICGENVKGLTLYNGRVVGIDYDITPPDPHELREALELLNKFVELSNFSKSRIGKISTIIKWFIVAGLGWIYKQLGLWLPHLYIYGESDTGKTKTAQFLSNIWNEQQMGSIGSIDSPYRLGMMLSKSTFPVIINEMNFDELSEEIRELWKNAVDGKLVRTRYGKKIKAYALFCFTSNSSLPTQRAIKKRLCSIQFDITDSKILLKEENVKAFENLMAEREKLNAIGRFVANWVNGHLEDLKNKEWISVAEDILKTMYEFAGMWVPEWVYMRDSEEEEDVFISKSDEIRAFIYNKFIKVGLLKPGKIVTEEVFIEAHNLIDWINYREREGDIVITRSILNELKKEGIKLSGLKDLAYYIPNAEYRAKVKVAGITRSGVIVAPRDLFNWLGLYNPDYINKEVDEISFDLSEELLKD